jgi:hypothetical protein
LARDRKHLVPVRDLFGSDIPDAVTFWNNWKVGQPIEIFVNPGLPEQVVGIINLNAKRRSHHLAIVIGG